MTQKVLGKEFDDDLRTTLGTVLREMGATLVDQTWGVAGSQEIEILVLDLRGEKIVVESETYIGLSICGNDEIVAEIERRLGETRAASPET